jgi:formylglycine-generating enzyme required for sulfatase activity
LPTEAEWEYACRAGGGGFFGLASEGGPITFENLQDYAWFAANSGGQTQPVGKKRPNAWGFHDMHGNIWEWCADWFDPAFYEGASENDPLCATVATEKVFRGGCWALDPQYLRNAVRGGNLPTYKSQYVGLRIVRELTDAEALE